MSSFGEASGGQRAGRLAGLVVLGLWLAASGLIVFLMTALGIGSCSSDDGCADRAVFSFVLTPVIHVGALLLGVWLAVRRATGGKRTLSLVALAVAAPVVSLGSALLLVASG